MLSTADNELLTRTGPGTPMGSFIRQYWIPFVLAKDLEADGVPMRVRLMNEDLIAFRDSDGLVGLVDAYCAHRRAPLYFARNEDCGLRCVYHGWKYDRDGKCVDMPNERPSSNFKNKVSLTAYPCQERNGIVWTFMQKDIEPPPLPDFEWNTLPDENVYLSIRVESCNWLQALEGEIDSSHGPFLHSRIDGVVPSSQSLAYQIEDKHPKFEILEMDHGLAIAARRDLDEENYYWRVNQFALPFFTMPPPSHSDPTSSGHAWVPIDDEHTLCVMFSFNPNGPLSEKNRSAFHEGSFSGRETGHASVRSETPEATGKPFSKYWPKFALENDYEVDWRSQKTTYFSGLPGIWVQDAACQEGMGSITDRSRERLGSSDAGIIQARRLLMRLARALESEGSIPLSASDPSVMRIRSVGAVLAKDVNWVDAMRKMMDVPEDFEPAHVTS
jgi:phenylpropionate dioxygenase-like ring-hydroxylating dioxygenase large terminal subunit